MGERIKRTELLAHIDSAVRFGNGTPASFLEHIRAELLADAWVPATERLPDDDMTVMIAIKGSSDPVWMGWYDAEGWHTIDAAPLGGDVTHWKPIPEAPHG